MSGKKGLVLLIIMAILATSLVIYSSVNAQIGRPLLYWGRTGDNVYLLQRRLDQWGYYDGVVDGVYGHDTLQAVRKFQSRNGLRVDGIVGPETWGALGYRGRAVAQVSKAAAKGTAAAGDVNLLAHVVHAEAGSEPYRGKVAVGAVILNRVQDPRFPNSLSGVIYQPLAFESVSNGIVNRPPSQESIKAARSALNGWDPTYGSVFFWNPSKPVNEWIWSRNIIVRIGGHVFAK
ncbi:MAG: spore cortex-lytic enzyme [Halanaerobium sp.]|nr:spore cortex-lytic enzyme [Halanaerobium sp.]